MKFTKQLRYMPVKETRGAKKQRKMVDIFYQEEFGMFQSLDERISATYGMAESYLDRLAAYKSYTKSRFIVSRFSCITSCTV